MHRLENDAPSSSVWVSTQLLENHEFELSSALI